MREAHSAGSSILAVQTLDRELGHIMRERQKCEERNRQMVQESLETLNAYNERMGGAGLKRSRDRLVEAKKRFGNLVVSQYPQWAAAAENPIEFQKAVFARALEMAKAKKEEEELALRQQMSAHQDLAHSRETYLEWTKANHILRLEREKMTAQALAEHQLYNSSFLSLQKEMHRQMQTVGADSNEAARKAMMERMMNSASPIQFERDDSRPFTAGSVLPQLDRITTPQTTEVTRPDSVEAIPKPGLPQVYPPHPSQPQAYFPPPQTYTPATQTQLYASQPQSSNPPAQPQVYAPQPPSQPTQVYYPPPQAPPQPAQPQVFVPPPQASVQPPIYVAPPSVPATQPQTYAPQSQVPPPQNQGVMPPPQVSAPQTQPQTFFPPPQSQVEATTPTRTQAPAVGPTPPHRSEELKVEVLPAKSQQGVPVISRPVAEVTPSEPRKAETVVPKPIPKDPMGLKDDAKEDEIQSSGEFDFEKFASFGNRSGPPRNLGTEAKTKLEKGPAKKPAPGSMVFDPPPAQVSAKQPKPENEPATRSDPPSRAEPSALKKLPVSKEIVIADESEDELPIDIISSERGKVQEKQTDNQAIMSGIPVVLAKGLPKSPIATADPREEVKTPDPRVIGVKTGKGEARMIMIEASDEDSGDPGTQTDGGAQPEVGPNKPLKDLKPKTISPMFSPESTQGIRMPSPMSSTSSLPLDKPQMKPMTSIVGVLKPNDRIRILGELIRKSVDLFSKTRARLNPDYKPVDGRLEEVVKSFAINRPVSVKLADDYVNAVLVIGYDLPYPFFPTEILKRKRGFNEPEFLEAMSGEAQSIFGSIKEFMQEGVKNGWVTKEVAANMMTSTLLNYRTSKSQFQRAVSFVTSVLENRGRVTTSDLNSSFGDDRSQGKREPRSISPNRVDMRAPSPQDSRTFKSVKQAMSISSVSQKSGIDSFEEIADTE